jgi:hypothetical protein
MRAGDREMLNASDLEHYFPAIDFPYLPQTSISQLPVAYYRLNDEIITVVRLFSIPLLTLMCIIPAEGFDVAQLEGVVVVNDS